MAAIVCGVWFSFFINGKGASIENNGLTGTARFHTLNREMKDSKNNSQPPAPSRSKGCRIYNNHNEMLFHPLAACKNVSLTGITSLTYLKPWTRRERMGWLHPGIIILRLIGHECVRIPHHTASPFCGDFFYKKNYDPLIIEGGRMPDNPLWFPSFTQSLVTVWVGLNEASKLDSTLSLSLLSSLIKPS